jgi:hypothetical protein
VLTCSKFITTSEYAPRLRGRLAIEQQLIDDARARGWQREIERHECTRRRLGQLLDELGEVHTPRTSLARRSAST